jgi:hypothetical protein
LNVPALEILFKIFEQELKLTPPFTNRFNDEDAILLTQIFWALIRVTLKLVVVTA